MEKQDNTLFYGISISTIVQETIKYRIDNDDTELPLEKHIEGNIFDAICDRLKNPNVLFVKTLCSGCMNDFTRFFVPLSCLEKPYLEDKLFNKINPRYFIESDIDFKLTLKKSFKRLVHLVDEDEADNINYTDIAKNYLEFNDDPLDEYENFGSYFGNGRSCIRTEKYLTTIYDTLINYCMKERNPDLDYHLEQITDEDNQYSNYQPLLQKKVFRNLYDGAFIQDCEGKFKKMFQSYKYRLENIFIHRIFGFLKYLDINYLMRNEELEINCIIEWYRDMVYNLKKLKMLTFYLLFYKIENYVLLHKTDYNDINEKSHIQFYKNLFTASPKSMRNWIRVYNEICSILMIEPIHIGEPNGSVLHTRVSSGDGFYDWDEVLHTLHHRDDPDGETNNYFNVFLSLLNPKFYRKPDEIDTYTEQSFNKLYTRLWYNENWNKMNKRILIMSFECIDENIEFINLHNKENKDIRDISIRGIGYALGDCHINYKNNIKLVNMIRRKRFSMIETEKWFEDTPLITIKDEVFEDMTYDEYIGDDWKPDVLKEIETDRKCFLCLDSIENIYKNQFLDDSRSLKRFPCCLEPVCELCYGEWICSPYNNKTTTMTNGRTIDNKICPICDDYWVTDNLKSDWDIERYKKLTNFSGINYDRGILNRYPEPPTGTFYTEVKIEGEKCFLNPCDNKYEYFKNEICNFKHIRDYQNYSDNDEFMEMFLMWYDYMSWSERDYFNNDTNFGEYLQKVWGINENPFDLDIIRFINKNFSFLTNPTRARHEVLSLSSHRLDYLKDGNRYIEKYYFKYLSWRVEQLKLKKLNK